MFHNFCVPVVLMKFENNENCQTVYNNAVYLFSDFYFLHGADR